MAHRNPNSGSRVAAGQAKHDECVSENLPTGAPLPAKMAGNSCECWRITVTVVCQHCHSPQAEAVGEVSRYYPQSRCEGGFTRGKRLRVNAARGGMVIDRNLLRWPVDLLHDGAI